MKHAMIGSLMIGLMIWIKVFFTDLVANNQSALTVDMIAILAYVWFLLALIDDLNKKRGPE